VRATWIAVAVLAGVLFLPAAQAGTGPTIRQMVGQLLLVRMHGTFPSADFLARIERGEIGGVVLYSDNFRTNPAPLILRLQAAARAGHQPKLIIGIDQEGGIVKRLPGAPTLAPPQMTTAATAEAQGLATARNLRSLGVNVDFAPVLDVNHGGFIAPRSFGKTAALVATRGAAFARGLADGGVAATAKHFPGLGYAKLNTDNAVATVTASAAKLRADWQPYREAHVPLVMLSTAIYPALGERVPAATSVKVIRALRQLGFDGVIVTDALQTPAVSRFYSTAGAAVRAIGAGADLVLVVGAKNSPDKSPATFDNLVSAAVYHRIDVRDAYARVLQLKASLKP
jgi:beta-N-acetylhexosaminidase